MTYLSRPCAFFFFLATTLLAGEPVPDLEKDVTNDFATPAQDLLVLDQGGLRVGIDRAKGASITWLSWKNYPGNTVNEADPGRLIQQSYYAGLTIDRKHEGQHSAWSPWSWNPIQGGGVGSWAKVTKFKKLDSYTLYAETIPRLWDMPNEEAEALMKQWTSLEKEVPNTIVVKCLIQCHRQENDAWGPARVNPQEVPACYFTRNFEHFQSYLGGGKWRTEEQAPGPPWGKTSPPKLAMACFEESGQGIAIFSPTAGPVWNFGPHSHGQTDNPKAGPCVHIAPVSRVRLGPQSSYQYRYWLSIGTREEIATQLDLLLEKYSSEKGILSDPEAKKTAR